MTVARTALVEWWPLADVGKLDVREGDVVVIRTVVPIPEIQKQRIVADWALAFPGIKAAVVAKADIDFAVERAIRMSLLWAAFALLAVAAGWRSILDEHEQALAFIAAVR